MDYIEKAMILMERGIFLLVDETTRNKLSNIIFIDFNNQDIRDILDTLWSQYGDV
jgi:hypothetical protein